MDRQAQTRVLSNGQLPLLEQSPPQRAERIRLQVGMDEVRRLKSESEALKLSLKAGGFEPKEVPLLFGIDAGQWSNICNGSKHFPHNRRNEFMDFVGNEILLMYGVESRGYDWASLRKHRSELEEELERIKRENSELKRERETIVKFVQETRK